MKRNFSKINKFLPLIFFVLIMTFIFAPQPVHAIPYGGGNIGTSVVNLVKDKITGAIFDVISVILTPIASLALGLMSLLTMIGGIFLNQVVLYTIVNVKQNLPDESISTTWGILRDIANMSFIFILLYTSILLIIGQRSINDARKLIVNVVIAAILINFSMFLTRLVIDAGNLLALVFYRAVAPGALDPGATEATRGISNSITNVLNISTLWKEVGTISNEKIITVGIFGSILLLVSAFVFFAVGLILLIRYVVLIFVIIFSPIAFVADILPGAKPYFQKWKDALLNNAFFPAIFFLVMWVALTILNSLDGVIKLQDGTLAAAFGSGTTEGGVQFTPSNVGLLVNFIIVIIFIISALLISKSMASKTAGGVDKIVGRATGWAGAASFGMAGNLGRRTLGSAGAAVADSERVKATAQQKGLGGAMARLTLAAGKKTSKTSFDMRSAGFTKPLAAGNAQKGGYEQMLKDQTKKKEEEAKALAPSDIVIDKAKQDFENTKKESEKIRREVESEVDSTFVKSPELLEAERTLDLMTKLSKDETVSEDRREFAKSEIEKTKILQLGYQNERQKRIDENERLKKIKNSLKEVETRKDMYVGVNEDEAKKRVRAEAEKRGLKGKEIDEYMKTNEAKKEIELVKVKSIGDKRKEDFANNLSNPGFWSSDRNLYIGKVKRGSKQAAANLRKGKKPVKDTLEEILKEAGDIPKKEEEETVTETKPAAGETGSGEAKK